MMPTVRVVVGVTDSPDSRLLLRHAVAEARRRHALLVPVVSWGPGGEVVLDPADESDQRRAAEGVLADIVTDTLGPEEAVPVRPRAVRAASLEQAVALVATGPEDVVFTAPPRHRAWEGFGLHAHRPAAPA